MKLVGALTHALGVAAPSSQGEENYDSTRKLHRFHDGVRVRSEPEMGYMPYAYAIGCGPRDVATTILTLAQGGGALATAVVLEGHMLLESITFRETSSAQVRGPSAFYIYEERLNNSGSLELVPGAIGTLASFTPTVASNRTIPAITPPVYLPPGTYWVVLRNENASRGLGVGTAPAGTMGQNVVQTKTIPDIGTPGDPLDLITGWTKAATPWTGLRLNGRVFGQAAAF